MPLDATLGGKDVPMADFRRFLPRVFRSPIRSSAFLLFGELPSLRGVKTLERTRGPHIPCECGASLLVRTSGGWAANSRGSQS